MKGRRVPFATGDDPAAILAEPGDYCGPLVGFTGDKPAVFFIAPIGDGLRHVCAPPHVFTECDDGTLTIRESIGCLRRDGCPGYAWHGFLTCGVWAQEK